MKTFEPHTQASEIGNISSPRFLKPDQVAMIDDAICALGEYGEVRLVIDKGRLRFIIMQKSYDAQKWRCGSIE
jgi:hypothetical protein